MKDTDVFSDQEILALTALGESESLGPDGMKQTLGTVMNRARANLRWMGGGNMRDICLRPNQYQCWDPGGDRRRIMDIGLQNQLYGPYVTALSLAQSALDGTLVDVTNGAVSYGDAGTKPMVRKGSMPCLVVGRRTLFDLHAVS